MQPVAIAALFRTTVDFARLKWTGVAPIVPTIVVLIVATRIAHTIVEIGGAGVNIIGETIATIIRRRAS